jgi:hypothetical protein
MDFNHFRTIGMRRSVEEGVTSRFVTGERIQALLKVCVFVLVALSFPEPCDSCTCRKRLILGRSELPSIWTVL